MSARDTSSTSSTPRNMTPHMTATIEDFLHSPLFMGDDPHQFKINATKLEAMMKSMLYTAAHSDLTQRQVLNCTNKAKQAALGVLKATQASYDELDITKQEEALKLVVRATALLQRDTWRVEDIKNDAHSSEIPETPRRSTPKIDLTSKPGRKETPASNKIVKRHEDGSMKTNIKWSYELGNFFTSSMDATTALEKNKERCEQEVAVLRIRMEKQVMDELKEIAQDA